MRNCFDSQQLGTDVDTVIIYGAPKKQNKKITSEKYLLIMSSSLARSACGKAGSSFSSRWDPSPWPCSSVGLTGEFSLDELGDDVWNEMGALQIQL